MDIYASIQIMALEYVYVLKVKTNQLSSQL